MTVGSNGTPTWYAQGDMRDQRMVSTGTKATNLPVYIEIGTMPIRRPAREGAEGVSITICAKKPRVPASISMHRLRQPPAMSITMIGLDTAKSLFQVHGVNETGRVEIRRKLRRSELNPSPAGRHAMGAWRMGPQDKVPRPPPVDAVILFRAHDVGGFEVRRALPAHTRQMVGPFIFFDQMDRASSWRATDWTCDRIRISVLPR
jgi:hypothetical protein